MSVVIDIFAVMGAIWTFCIIVGIACIVGLSYAR